MGDTLRLRCHACNNSGVVELSKQRESSARSRHIERRYLKIREWVLEGHIVVKYVPTDDNRADLLTKPMKPDAFVRHSSAIMGSAPSAAPATTASSLGVMELWHRYLGSPHAHSSVADEMALPGCAHVSVGGVEARGFQGVSVPPAPLGRR